MLSLSLHIFAWMNNYSLIIIDNCNVTLVSRRQTQPSATRREGSGQLHCASVYQEFNQIFGYPSKPAVWILFINSIYKFNYQVARYLTLLTNTSTVSWPDPSGHVAEGRVWLHETNVTYLHLQEFYNIFAFICNGLQVQK